ncbi:MAG: DUF502 domain-containing protein [Elusimicrobiota bacterium]
MIAKFRKYFFTGLAIILPGWLTLYILWLLFLFIGNFVSPFVEQIFHYIDRQYFPLYSLTVDILSFILTITITCTFGFIANKYAGPELQKQVDIFFNRLPFVRQIYNALSKFTKMLFGESGTPEAFKHVVLARFPKKDDFVIGFITNEIKLKSPDRPGEYIVPVFIPTTPNPATGYFVFFHEKDLKETDLAVDEAIKIIISGGIVMPLNKRII